MGLAFTGWTANPGLSEFEHLGVRCISMSGQDSGNETGFLHVFEAVVTT